MYLFVDYIKNQTKVKILISDVLENLEILLSLMFFFPYTYINVLIGR